MNTTLTRIEREAKEYADNTWKHWPPSLDRTAHTAQSLADYGCGAIRESNRAAPLLKALEKIQQWARLGQDGHSTADPKQLFSLIEGECE